MASSNTSFITGVLMQKVKDSDQKAFRELYTILWKPLYVRVFTILRNRQVCEDILQEVWIDLWQRRKDIENENIEAYLFRAVRFKAYNHYRNATTRRTILQNLLATRESMHKNDVEESVNLKETERAVMSLIDTLPPKCKRVFELSRLEGLKNREISQKLNISKSTVENHISNALKVLKAHIASLVLTAGWFLLYL